MALVAMKTCSRERRASASDSTAASTSSRFDRASAAPLSKLNALTLVAAEQQTHNYYMNIGPLFADPLARQLYAEIASIEQQHVTHYESLLDPQTSLLENWLLHEAMEAYTYYSCLHQEGNPRIQALWERMLSYELGHLRLVAELFKKHEGRDPAGICASLEESRRLMRTRARCELREWGQSDGNRSGGAGAAHQSGGLPDRAVHAAVWRDQHVLLGQVPL